MIAPRIIPRDALRGSHILVPPAPANAPTCWRPIKLGDRVYRCGREVSFDRQHDGIRDAFCEHFDGGSVRW